MITNVKSTMINRPIEQVFAYVSDFQNNPQWQNALLETRRLTEGPLGVGTEFTGVRKFMGRKMESVLQFTTYEPNKEIVYKSVSGQPFEGSFLFEATGECTKLTSVLKLQTGGLLGLAEPLIAANVERESEANYSDLKALLENQVSGVPA
jgi:uncharacterized membrane protein